MSPMLHLHDALQGNAHIVGSSLSLKCTHFLLHPVLPEHLTPGIQCTRGSKPEGEAVCVRLLITRRLLCCFLTAIILPTAIKKALRILTRNSSHKKQSITPGVLGSRQSRMKLTYSQGPTQVLAMLEKAHKTLEPNLAAICSFYVPKSVK